MSDRTHVARAAESGGAEAALGRAALVSLLVVAAAAPAALDAQGTTPEGRWLLQPLSRADRVIAPFLEGWYANDDGTVTYSFGYLNLNDFVVEIPVGERNLIEPSGLGGLQPTVFLPGRRRGMFAVTVPASQRTDDIWWRITNPNGQVTEVPGTTSWNAYRIDWTPRPHGTLPPEVSFDGGQLPIGPGLGPAGVLAERTLNTTVGAVTTLSVHVKDVSVRSEDETDPDVLAGPATLRVVWTPYQAPTGAKVDFSRHDATPDHPAPRVAAWRTDGAGCYSAVPCATLDEDQTVVVPSGEGTARVLATFSEPGEYMMHAQVDNWGLPDSGFTDQCCFANGYVRVTVGPS